ncbi:MAG TPA: GNAT family N-acetyltransferase [Devosia sp.]
MTLSVRQLTTADAAAFRDLRLLGLQESPEAFGSSFEAEKDRTVESFADSIERGHIVGAFADGALVAVAGFYVMAAQKMAHRGVIWGVYVHPEARGQGAGRDVLNAVIDHAGTRVLQVHLTVVTSNGAALRLYEKLGFAIYGTEPRSLRLDGRFLDEHLMVRRFDA